MRPLNTPQQLREAEAAARRVFQSIGTGATNPFREEVEARMLIYPTDYTMLDEEQFHAVAVAAAAVGDDTAYLVPYGTLEAGWAGTHEHRLITLKNFADYKPEGSLILEHLLYSPKGRWGLATSDSGDAVAGGPWAFVEALRDHLPEEEQMVGTFIRDSKDIGRGGGNIDWLHPLLVHLYGETRAHVLWDQPPGSATSE